MNDTQRAAFRQCFPHTDPDSLRAIALCLWDECSRYTNDALVYVWNHSEGSWSIEPVIHSSPAAAGG